MGTILDRAIQAFTFLANKWALDVNIVNNKAHALLVDESGSITYVGLAEIGSLEAAAVWQIKKIEIQGSVTSVKYADGDANFNNAWDDRISLTYL